jgi:hypothetical protein
MRDHTGWANSIALYADGHRVVSPSDENIDPTRFWRSNLQALLSAV